MQSSDDGTESTTAKGISKSEDNNILSFLDSMDSYLILMDSLSSALRQYVGDYDICRGFYGSWNGMLRKITIGWFELASARHSMGASRVNSSLFDLKSHYASTTLQVHEDDASPDKSVPHFTLSKWASSDDPEKNAEEAKFQEDELLQNKSKSPKLQRRGTSQHSELQDGRVESGGSPVTVDNQAERERFKSLSMFGMLVSPKLRATQSSFEKALEMLVEVSNVQASLKCAHDRVQADLKTTT